MRASRDLSRVDSRPIQFDRDIAPMMSNWRMSLCPALKTWPSRFLPPLECCLGPVPAKRQSPTGLEVLHRRGKCFDCQSRQRSRARHGLEPSGDVRLSGQGLDAVVAGRKPPNHYLNLPQQIVTFPADNLGQIIVGMGNDCRDPR
jgi:hypothetical protein